MIYKPTKSEVARTHQDLEKEPISTAPIASQRQSGIAAFVRRLGNAIGVGRGSMQSPHRHGHVYDKSDVENRARLHPRLFPRIRTYSFDTATNGRVTTTKQAADHQSDEGMAGFGASEMITDGEARQLSSFKMGHPDRAPRIGGGNTIDLEGMVTDFIRAEESKRSVAGSAVGSGRQGSGSEHPPSPV
jgi:hypothetical protein